MDMTYATIPVRNESKILYSEKRLPYVVSSQAHPDIHHVYTIDTNLGSSIFFNDEIPCNSKIVRPQKDEAGADELKVEEESQKDEGLWKMYFDGSVSKAGASVGVYIISPTKEAKGHSYKLIFECFNNVAEYEALLLGLRALKYASAKRVQIFGDSELVINQVSDIYQTKHLRMRAYWNEVWDMFGNFFTKHTFQVIPKDENTVADSLVTAAGKFEAPVAQKKKYKVEIVNRPSILDNTKHWQVF